MISRKASTLMLLALAAVPMLPAMAFEPVTDHSFNTWFAPRVRYNITDRWGITGEVMLRRADGFARWQQYALRPSVNYVLNPQLELSLGYTYAHLYPYGNQPVAMDFSENNAWEQVLVSQKVGKSLVTNRFRMEQRFVERVTVDPELPPRKDGTQYMNRFRYRIGGSFPVALEDRLFLSVFDEIFVHLEDEMLVDAFDQNRVYLGLGYRLSNNIRMELGMMHQYLRKRDGVHFESNPTMFMGFGFEFGPMKPKRKEFIPNRPT